MKRIHQFGSIMNEYMLVLVLLSAGAGFMLYGNVWDLGEGNGGRDGDPATSDPAVLELLDDKQHEFAHDIYQP